MHTEALERWLDYLAGLHPAEIELGLERVCQAGMQLGLARPAATVITVAGTNGKGTVCALLESLLLAQGLRTGLYTSPHLLRFNERIRIDGREIGSESLCAAFAHVEASRGDVSLTQFEFVTLAALLLFQQQDLDVAILEVGLGGRLDAANVVDADVAVITTVDIDHEAWLGPGIERIAVEKAGIARSGRPTVSGDPHGPGALRQALAERGAAIHQAGIDFHWGRNADGTTWHWHDRRNSGHDRLPLPALAGEVQLRNIATALAALSAAGLPAGEQAARAAIRGARLPGRFQVIDGETETILDVAHNPQAARALATALRDRSCSGHTHLVLGMYADKDHAGVIAALAPVVDCWYCAGLPPPRGLDADTLAGHVVQQSRAPCRSFRDPCAARDEAVAAATPGDRVVIAGSFATVARAGRHFL